MTLDEARRKLPFLLYDELDFEEENEISRLLAEHEDLRAELERLRLLARAVDSSATEPPPGLLSQCRSRLHGALREQPVPLRRGLRDLLPGWLRFVDRPLFTRTPLGWQVAGALAMLAVGVMAGRATLALPGLVASNPGQGSPGQFVSQNASRSDAPDWTPRVRDIRTNPDGTVRIEFEEVKQRLVEGPPQDQQIRALLLATARSTVDPGMRVGPLSVLSAQSAQPAVREVLLHALRNDSNPGVRLKALEGLQAYANEAQVRETLRTALLHDESPAVRLEAVGLLTRERDRPEVIGLLQELMQFEENRTVRERCQSALADLNATTETF
ncbi:MAG: HEAT repeat domain-containing protein [Bryobacterales bacterium]|jgi:hypothetical protein|nr:HEAT repeat domain-containing protein [Bryobacterales bacterium]